MLRASYGGGEAQVRPDHSTFYWPFPYNPLVDRLHQSQKVASIMDLSKAIDRIPTELWMTIFHFATTIENYDEFARGSTTIIPDLIHDNLSTSGPCFIPRNTLLEALRARLRIVLVCKRWYDIGLPILWSHLVIEVPKWSYYRSRIRAMLGQKPELCSLIVRLGVEHWTQDVRRRCLSVDEMTEVQSDIRQFLERHLFPKMQKLRVLRIPEYLSICELSIHREFTSIYPVNQNEIRYDTTSIRDPRSLTLVNTRILDFDMDQFEKRTTFDLPHLQQLRFASNWRVYVEEVVFRWRAPRLESLSVLCYSFRLHTSSLAWSRMTLVSLHLQDFTWLEGYPVELPKLRNLFLQQYPLNFWHGTLIAPNLEAIHLKNTNIDALYDSYRDTFISFFAQMFQGYPSCETIYYYRRSSLPGPNMVIVTVRERTEPEFELNFEPPLASFDDHNL
jgi:hypothetical protein